MGCGSSTPVAKDAAPIEQAHTATSEPIGKNGVRTETSERNTKTKTGQKVALLPTSSLAAVEFGLVKGLEYGDKSAPALLVVQVSCSRLCELVSLEMGSY